MYMWLLSWSFCLCHCSCHWVHLLCYVFEEFHWNNELLVSPSVILVMFMNIFFSLVFLDTIYKVMFVLLCMRKQKNGCVLLAEGSLWVAVLQILPTWYCHTISQKINQTIIQHIFGWISTQELPAYSINNILVSLKWYNQSVHYLYFL